MPWHIISTLYNSNIIYFLKWYTDNSTFSESLLTSIKLLRLGKSLLDWIESLSNLEINIFEVYLSPKVISIVPCSYLISQGTAICGFFMKSFTACSNPGFLWFSTRDFLISCLTWSFWSLLSLKGFSIPKFNCHYLKITLHSISYHNFRNIAWISCIIIWKLYLDSLSASIAKLYFSSASLNRNISDSVYPCRCKILYRRCTG